MSITPSFFELQSPDFAWKFVCQNVKFVKNVPAIHTQKEQNAKMQNDKSTKKKLSGASYQYKKKQNNIKQVKYKTEKYKNSYSAKM